MFKQPINRRPRNESSNNSKQLDLASLFDFSFLFFLSFLLSFFLSFFLSGHHLSLSWLLLLIFFVSNIVWFVSTAAIVDPAAAIFLPSSSDAALICV